MLWPKKATFDELLAILNVDELKSVWSEDETIGWVYQFFNSSEERRMMREESQVPRNSRELAIRNQFFTPRYIVQFLCDNTLGRIWYEMRKGDTRLVETCEYMARRPREIFGGENEDVSPDVIPENPSQSELSQQSTRISHREKRDPRGMSSSTRPAVRGTFCSTSSVFC